MPRANGSGAGGSIAQVCECGHAVGEHKSSGSRSLSARALDSLYGICLCPGCCCAQFREATPDPPKTASGALDSA